MKPKLLSNIIIFWGLVSINSCPWNNSSSSNNNGSSGPFLTETPPTWAISDHPKTMTARVENLSGWQIVDPEVQFCRNDNLLDDGIVHPQRINTSRATVGQDGSSLSINVPTNLDNFAPNQIIYFRWKIGIKKLSDNSELPLWSPIESVRFSDCPSGQTLNSLLVSDQNMLAARYGTLTGNDDVSRLGLVPTHGWANLDKMGVAFLVPNSVLSGLMINIRNYNPSRPPDCNPASLAWGNPGLLFYAPALNTNTTDQNPDFPYILIGWAYGDAYIPGRRPNLPCVPFEDWFIHEAGYHLMNGGFIPDAPSENNPGDAMKCTPTFPPITLESLMWHPRLWDLHIWRVASGVNGGVPILSKERPPGTGVTSELPTGLSVPSNSFFYPTIPTP
jgi:hypothetical protein